MLPLLRSRCFRSHGLCRPSRRPLDGAPHLEGLCDEAFRPVPAIEEGDLGLEQVPEEDGDRPQWMGLGGFHGEWMG